jgi:RNA recognition motif-containing protein
VQFPPNCRVFIGNLAAERTSPAEIAAIFSKYGKLAEEPLLRRSFGFVQYDNPDAAQAAIHGAQGVEVGGLKIDVTLADNRPVRPRGADGERDDDRRGRGGDRMGERDRVGNKRDRDRENFREKERDRSWSRERDRGPRDDRGGAWRKGPDGGRMGDRDKMPRRMPEPPSAVNDVFMVKVDNPSRAYCLMVEERITSLNLLYESREVDLDSLPDVLKVAAEHSSVKHILVVGSRHEGNETITITTRRPSGTVEGELMFGFNP